MLAAFWYALPGGTLLPLTFSVDYFHIPSILFSGSFFLVAPAVVVSVITRFSFWFAASALPCCRMAEGR